MVWLTGSGIFNPVLRIQIQVQVLPVATAATLVCRYMVKYHGECFDCCVLSKFFISLTHVDTCSITTTVPFAPCSRFCYPKYVPSEHKQNQTTHHDISPHIYIRALLPSLLVVLGFAFVRVAQGWILRYLSAIPYCCRVCLTTAEARSNSVSFVCYSITASIQEKDFILIK